MDSPCVAPIHKVVLLLGNSAQTARETYVLHFDYNEEAASGIADIREKTLKDCARKMLRILITGGQEIFARRLGRTSMFMLVEAPREHFAVQGFVPKQAFKVKEKRQGSKKLPPIHLDFHSKAQPVCEPLTVDKLQNLSVQSRAVAAGGRGATDSTTGTIMGLGGSKRPLTEGAGQREQQAQENGADAGFTGDIWFMASAKIKGF
jgi:hypothetical protein